MALVVEDGTGVSGADSYASLAAAAAYWGKRPHDAIGRAWLATSTTDAYREGALREASDYLDATFGPGYLGARATTAQGRLWPRMTVLAAPGVTLPLYKHYGIARPYGPAQSWLLCETDASAIDLTKVYGADGVALAALPPQIVTATIELAARALTGRLAPDQVGGRIKSESAGDTKFEYFEGGSASPAYGIVTRLLAGVLGAAGQASWNWR